MLPSVVENKAPAKHNEAKWGKARHGCNIWFHLCKITRTGTSTEATAD